MRHIEKLLTSYVNSLERSEALNLKKSLSDYPDPLLKLPVYLCPVTIFQSVFSVFYSDMSKILSRVVG